MNYRELHSWEVSPAEASRLQRDLKKEIISEGSFDKIKKIAGADISFSGEEAYAGVIVLSFPDFGVIEGDRETADGQMAFGF